LRVADNHNSKGDVIGFQDVVSFAKDLEVSGAVLGVIETHTGGHIHSAVMIVAGRNNAIEF